MRVFVFYDLPSKTKKERQVYNIFHSFLLKNGFYMIQWSIYCCLARNDDFAKKIIDRISKNTPKEGDVRCLEITENQYQNIRLFAGFRSRQELIASVEEVLEI